MPLLGRHTSVPARVVRAWDSDNVLDARGVCAAAIASVPYMDPLPREDAAWMCWQFLRQCITYVEETGHQFIRLPWRTLEDGYCDCKSSAVFVAALCAASGCDVALRFIVHPGESGFGHVYAIVDGTPVDPLVAFGSQMAYVRCEDIPIHD